MATVIAYAILAVVLFLIGLAAHSLSTRLYRRMTRKGNSNARGYRIAAFILSFLVITAVVFFVIAYNLRIER
jgi:formate-dependent nitrite reductase membrane component NrfD